MNLSVVVLVQRVPQIVFWPVVILLGAFWLWAFISDTRRL